MPAGRPKKIIDADLVLDLAKIHCTMKEMAGICDCSVDTLERNFAEIISKGRQEGKMTLRRLQWNAAQRGNVTMMIWLGKQWLEQIEKIEQTVEAKIEQVNNTEALAKKLTEILKTAAEIR